LQERLAHATDRRARVDDAIQAAVPEELSAICTAAPGIEFRAPVDEASNLFTAASRMPSLQANFEAARAPPPLSLIDPFVKRPESGGKYAKYGLMDTCADGYSDKHFFLKMWLDEEERKMEVLKAVRPRGAKSPAPRSVPPVPRRTAVRSTGACSLSHFLPCNGAPPHTAHPPPSSTLWLMHAWHGLSARRSARRAAPSGASVRAFRATRSDGKRSRRWQRRSF
jgi:hypothetical protein